MPESRTWRRRARSRSPWTCSPLILSTTVLAVLLVFAIAQSFVKRQLDPKGCRMSMMRPAFAKLVDFDTEHTRFASKYSLYLYREGGIDEDTMVKGVPVLFIPGNAGSYKQVRPLGAEAAQYFHDVVQHDTEAAGRGTRSLDFFTVDFNEDFTAFHGQTLLDQAEYLNEAVAYILSLYHDPRHSARDSSLPDPSSVILVGHSMGGIVARTMLIMPNYQANSINTIITMSTPHARPPVSFDAELVQTYTKINKYWRQAYSQKWANNNPLWHVTLISIAGGGLDTVVPSDYTSLSSLVPDTHGFTVFTSSVPDVWTGMDHLAILWCDQFRKIIVRALIEVVDARRASQTKPRAERMRVFKKWFLTGMESVAERTLPQKEPTTLLTLEDNSNSIISQGQRLSLRQLGSAGRPRAYLMPVPPQETPGGKRFTLLSDQKLDAPGENGKLEVLFCSVFPLHPGQSATLFSMNMDLSGDSSGSTRLACKNAAADTIHLPASTRLSQFAFEPTAPFSYLQYELEDLAEHQFVAIVDKAANPTPGWVIAEFSDNVDSIHWMNQLTLRQFLTNGLQLSLATIRPMVTEIKIPVLQSSLLAYKLRIGTQSCGKGSELFTPLLRQYITDPFESKFFVNVQEANINLHGVAPYIPPPLKPRTSVDGLSLQLWSDPTCDSALDVSLQVDVLGSLGKLVMRYSTVFAAFPLFVVALVLRKQFKVYDERGIFISFSESLDQCLRGSLPVLFFGLYFIALSVSRSSPAQTNPASYGIMDWQKNGTESALDMTKNDLLMGSQDPFFWFLVPLTGLITVGACVLVNYAALALIHVFSTAYSLFVSASVRIKNDDRRRSSSPAFAAISPRRRVITTAILFLLVATFIPYQFAYMVACLVQIATCTRAFRVARETRSGSHLNFYNYAHSVLILMLWVLPINLPILVVWLHNLAVHWLTPFSSHHNVLSIMPLILLVETLTTGTMIPRVTTRFRYVTDGLLFLLAIYADVYGVSYAYFLHQLVNFVAAWLVAIHFSTSSFSLSALLHSLLEGSNINAPLSSSSGANGSGSGSGSAVGSSRSSASGLFSAAFFSSSSNNPAQPGSSSGSSSGGGGGAGSNRISNSSSSSSTSNVKKRP
ncbi:PGAP1-domain-containing protein [Xylona heveae TC161]|uniref:GPI inositol-deacylase n=1 Tax=Xylona heveae (strain CBS 132557 / TC161) TaxID=1328760 RepID=A0A161TCI5_XYLHT|nr:PGAP1-domain-containing protein [Xylona heveae TC161]KZF23497.1 PGAP1-domain-containing protein [Xylona heveae TC161]